jgi:hypothetical protein
LLAKKETGEDKILQLLGELPFSFCVRFYKDSIPHWCFLIPEKVRNYEKVLGVSVSIDTQDPIDRIFLIPTSDFNELNCLVFSEQDTCFSSYVVKRENIEITLSTLI